MDINRTIQVTNKGMYPVLSVAQGTNTVKMNFTISDFNIPSGSSAVAYNIQPTGNIVSQICTVSGNTVSVTPPAYYFLHGKNLMQIQLSNGNSRLITFVIEVWCSPDISNPEVVEMSNPTVTQQLLSQMGMMTDRLNNLAKLPEGSTTGDAELADIRVGADGITYESAGEAVRKQFEKVSDQLENVNEGIITDTSLTKDGTPADAAATGAKIRNIESLFVDLLTSPYCLNRALISSDNKIYYKSVNDANYNTFNLFLFDVNENQSVSMDIKSPNNIVRVALSNQTMDELIEIITELNQGAGIAPDQAIYNGNVSEYELSELDVSNTKTLLVYVGTDVTTLDYTSNTKLSGKMVSPENTTFMYAVGGLAFESYEYAENNQGDIIAWDNATQKMYAYKNDSDIPSFAISFPVDTEHVYKIIASDMTRCRIALFNTTSVVYEVRASDKSRSYSNILYDDTRNNIDIDIIPEINGTIVAYMSNTVSFMDVTVQRSKIDVYTLDSKVKVGNENILDNTIKKEKLAFDISTGSATSGRIPLLSDILASETEDIDTIFEFDSAPNDWVTDSTGKVLDVSTEDFYDLFYNNWVGNHADGFTVTKTQLGMDQSGRYPIYEYDFCPQNYTYTVLLSSGMHTYELSAHFGLAWFMKTYMRQVDGENLSDGFEYLRKHVRIKVVPISNPWGWNQSPKKYGNYNGVNINRNFDYETDDGGSAWEQFPIQTDEWNQKGSAPFSEAETRILRDWALANPGAYFWIDCHTGLGLGPWDNFIYYSSDDKYADKIAEGLSTLEERIKTKYSKQNPTKEVRIDHSGSIRLRWGEKVAGIPGMTIEQTPNNTLWGTALNNESGDITEFAITVYCYIFSVLPYNIDAETWIQTLLS